jgi:amidase
MEKPGAPIIRVDEIRRAISGMLAQRSPGQSRHEVEIGVGDFEHLTAPFFALLGISQAALKRC